VGGKLIVGKNDILGGKTLKYILKIGCEYIEGVNLALNIAKCLASVQEEWGLL
jgi:hypothetical protein